MSNGRIGKIVGLDPASPLFKYNEPDTRLADTDAEYVEVIHTSGGSLGFSEPIGNASFYPNGGRAQPGCGWDLVSSCAHGRAYEFYLESIYHEASYLAFKCDSFDAMQKGRCSVSDETELTRMGGEPGIER